MTPTNNTQLLEKTLSFYEKTFANVAEGKEILGKIKIEDNTILSSKKIGYADGSLIEAIPEKGKTVNDLKKVGIINKDGKELFFESVVFPVFDVDNNIIDLVGFKDNEFIHLPEKSNGIFNATVCRTFPEIIIVDTIIDVLSLEISGIKNSIPLPSDGKLSKDDLLFLKEVGVTSFILMTDKNKIPDLEKQLSTVFEIKTIALPPKYTANTYLKKYGKEKLQALCHKENFQESLPTIPLEENISTPANTITQSIVTDGFIIICELRKYEIIGLEKKSRSMKATLRIEKGGKLHVDTINFYSNKERKQLVFDICNILEELPETINADIDRILNACEKWHPNMDAETAKNAGIQIKSISKEETEQALAFGRSPNLVESLLSNFETCGLIGEESNKLLCYLAMTSRKMAEPLSVLVLSSSGAGKSALQDAALRFCPPEDLVKLTNLSGKALFYKERTSLKNKVLAIEEGAGAVEASYAIRNLISSEGLTSEIAVRDSKSGKMTTMSNTVEGPVSVFCTTTDPDVDPETKSRFLVIGIDESREQTKKIIDFQRKRHSLDGLHVNLNSERVLALHRNFQRLLKPYPVVNPLIDELSYCDDRLQGRRAHPQYLNIINTVAFLRQMQKQVKTFETDNEQIRFLEVDEKDIEIGHKLALEILGKTLDELSIPARDLLKLIDEMLTSRAKKVNKKEETENKLTKHDIPFTRRHLREFTGWTQTRLRNHLKELIELEYLLVDSGGNGRVLQTYKLLYHGQGKDGERWL